MTLHNAHVVRFLQEDEHVEWYDAILDAAHWMALPDIAPSDAAMLLCGFNPNEESFEVAVNCTNTETGPQDLIRLKQRFEGLAKTVPEHRTLRDWHQAAREMGVNYHSWIDGYIEGTAPAQNTATPAPVVNDDKTWKIKARERAAEIIKRQRGKDLYPSQVHIADEIAREFRVAKITGIDDKPLSGAYIKRHALKGISSGQGKQLSTQTGRGKQGK